MMAMAQIVSPPAPTANAGRKKRQLLSSCSPTNTMTPPKAMVASATTSRIPQPPLPIECNITAVAYSAMGSFLHHLKQSTATQTIEIVSDNPKATVGFGEDACAIRTPVSSPFVRASKSHDGGKPRHIVMTADQKKNIRWDTHSSTYKLAAAKAAAINNDDSTAAKDAAIGNDSTSSHGSVDMPTTISADSMPPGTLVRRSSAAAPTCPCRRQSKEDLLNPNKGKDEDSESSHNSAPAVALDLSEELAKLRLEIEREEAHLKQVVQLQSASPRAPIRKRRSSLVGNSLGLQQAAALMEDELTAPKKHLSPRSKQRKRRDQLMKASRGNKSHNRSCSESPLPTKIKWSMMAAPGQHRATASASHLPDYKLALGAVAQRYSSRPGGLSSFRSVSTGVLPTTTTARSLFSDAPLGIPRRRESEDVTTLAALDEAALIVDSRQ